MSAGFQAPVLASKDFPRPVAAPLAIDVAIPFVVSADHEVLLVSSRKDILSSNPIVVVE